MPWQCLRYRARLSGTYWRYVYNGDRVLEETNDSGTVQARYTTESGSYYEPLQHIWRTGEVSRFPAYDAIGSVMRLLDANANTTDVYDQDAFGSLRASSGSTPNPYRYGGAWGYITDPSGMLQLGARFYWPEVGRFVSQDPVRDGVNWYAYVRSRPTADMDPAGFGTVSTNPYEVGLLQQLSCLVNCALPFFTLDTLGYVGYIACGVCTSTLNPVPCAGCAAALIGAGISAYLLGQCIDDCLHPDCPPLPDPNDLALEWENGTTQ